jgi:hypothetical protein
MTMSNLYDNLVKSVAGAAAALVVTWVMSYGFVQSTQFVRGSVTTSPVVAALGN